MNRIKLFVTIVAVFAIAASACAAEDEKPSQTWLSLAPEFSKPADDTVPKLSETDPVAPPTKGPPLPLHCFEGYGGGVITPTAYFCNPGQPGSVMGFPTTSFTYLDMGSKNLYSFAITQVFFERFEFGYAYNYLYVGSLYDDVAKAGLNMGRDHVQLHHFNLRINFIKENSCDLPLPAITGGVHFKYNPDIGNIDDSLGHALRAAGMDRDWGIDYTITATKMFPTLVFGRPLILTGGLRFTNAAQLGIFGFGHDYKPYFEGNVIYLPIDQIALAYEFRGKDSPYETIPELIDSEDNWHAVSLTWIICENLTVTGVYGILGNVANADANSSFAIQVRWEF